MNRRSKPDLGLIKALLVRLMTRNIADRTAAMLARVQFERNLLSLGSEPHAHLAATMRIMDARQREGLPIHFETGLMFGVTMALASGNPAGHAILQRMLADIGAQQEGGEGEPEPRERSGLMLPVDDPTDDAVEEAFGC